MKFWKNWPYWLRGGVVGGGVAIVSITLTSTCEYLTTPPIGHENLGLQCIPFTIPLVPFWFTKLVLLPDIIYIIVVVLTWSLISIAVGAIVGRIKKRARR